MSVSSQQLSEGQIICVLERWKLRLGKRRLLIYRSVPELTQVLCYLQRWDLSPQGWYPLFPGGRLLTGGPGSISTSLPGPEGMEIDSSCSHMSSRVRAAPRRNPVP